MQSKISEKVRIPIKLLDDLQGNFKTLGKKQFENLKGSIEKNGFIQPFFVWKSGGKNYILDGHQRKKAIIDLYGDNIDVDCLEIKAEDLKEAKKFCVYYASSYAEFNKESLLEFGDELDFDDLKNFSFPNISFSEDDFLNVDSIDGEDEIPETTKNELGVQLGDIYTLGDHRLMCGDSTDLQTVEKLMNGQKIDMVFTSPPYNVGIDYETHDDSMHVDQYADMICEVLSAIKYNESEDISILWNKGSSIHESDFRLDIKCLTKIWELHRVIIWKKKGITGPPLFAHTKNNPVSKNYMPFFGFEFIFEMRNQKSIGTKTIPDSVLSRRMTDVWEINQSSDSSTQDNHPAAFPVELAHDAICLYSNNNVFDPFGGSGSTIIAAEKTKRKCFTMEIDPHYCSVIIKRWEKFSGKKAVKSQ